MTKKIIISLGILLATTGITIGILFLVQQNSPENIEENTELVVNESKDYQACDILSTEALKESLGDAGQNLQAPENLGIVEEQPVGDGVDEIVADSQICVYAFAEGGSLENSFNSNNALIIEKTVYQNEGGTTAILQQVEADPTAIAVELTELNAFYIPNVANDGPDPAASFELQVFSSTERTTLTIRQPADETTFTNDSAQAALEAIAQQL
jgi:hypothetical protein